MNNINRLIYFLLLTILFPIVSQAMNSEFEEGDQVIPHFYPLFTVKYSENEKPTICRVTDFQESCGRDNECKTRKGMCGEILSENFFHSGIKWEKLDGKYDTNRGFDGFYKVTGQSVKFVIVEDKGGEVARLDPKTSQMSKYWQRKTAAKLFKKSKISKRDWEDFNSALSKGDVVSLFTRTLYEEDKTPSKEKNKFTSGYSFSNLSISNKSHSNNPSSSSGLHSSSLPSIHSQPKYIFHTEVSLLGSSQWSYPYKTSYLANYQKDIHPSFKTQLLNNNCSLNNGNYCLDWNETEEKNFNILSTTSPSEITFGT